MAPGAVMSPFYAFSYPLKLSEDDKRGIQYLYGSKRTEDNVKTEERFPKVTETNEIETTVVSYMTSSDLENLILLYPSQSFFLLIFHLSSLTLA